MKTFVSWSGQRSRQIAAALKAWLPDVIQQVDVWMSEHDVDAGSRWGLDLTNILEETHFGIICLTPENQDAPWLLFESGCLAKTAKIARVVPYLHGLTPADIRYPLAQFQGVAATKSGTLKLLQSINEAGQIGIPGDRLEKFFEKWWPDLEKTLATIGAVRQTPVPSRSEREILEEILDLVRNSMRQASILDVVPLKSQGIVVDTRKFFVSGSEVLTVPYRPNDSVSKFLDTLYFELNEIGHVPAYEYGTVWLLRDQLSGRQYDDIGIEYCNTNGAVKDDRTIESVGIRAGDKLEVIRLLGQKAHKPARGKSRKIGRRS